MKYINMRGFFFLLLLFSTSLTEAQNQKPEQDSFFIISIPMYDVDGNEYRYQKKFNHVPTKEDSILYNSEREAAFKTTIDSVERREASEQSYVNLFTSRNKQKVKPKQYAAFYPKEGKHLFSLQWISWEKFGAVFIRKTSSSTFSIKGSQKDEKGNYVTIDGHLTPVKTGLLEFNGEIVTKTINNNNGLPCKKNGKYYFLCSPGRKYWRLQEMENCEGNSVVDYIDIFF